VETFARGIEMHTIDCPNCKAKIELSVYPSWVGSVLVAIGVFAGIGLGFTLGTLI
jgi:hypothetical protein